MVVITPIQIDNQRDKVVFGIHDPQVREKPIQHADLTLAIAIDICHAA